MYGIVDIGSNTMRLSCYQVNDKKLEYVFHKKSMAGLAGYVNKKGELSKKGIRKSIEVLSDFQNIIQSVGLDAIYIIATASFRNVSNTEAILKQIFEETGMRVTVLSGEEEAAFDYLAATHQYYQSEGILIDIGGGSTEIVSFKDHLATKSISIPIGSLNTFSCYVKLLLPKKNELNHIKDHVKQQLKKQDLKQYDRLIGIGGTNRACLKLYNYVYDKKATNMEMESKKILALYERIRSLNKKEIDILLRVVPDRIHTILPGMTILIELIRSTQCEWVLISNWGVREGYLLQQLF